MLAVGIHEILLRYLFPDKEVLISELLMVGFDNEFLREFAFENGLSKSWVLRK